MFQSNKWFCFLIFEPWVKCHYHKFSNSQYLCHIACLSKENDNGNKEPATNPSTPAETSSPKCIMATTAQWQTSFIRDWSNYKVKLQGPYKENTITAMSLEVAKFPTKSSLLVPIHALNYAFLSLHNIQHLLTVTFRSTATFCWH